MDKKVALITGASNGIGAQMAREFAKNGYCVVVNYNQSKEKAQNVVNEIVNNGNNAICVKADVTNEDEVLQMLKETLSVYGHIDVLINNAGVCNYNLLIDEHVDSIKKQINTNLLGTILCSKAVTSLMLKQGYGKIINMSSIWGVNGASLETIYSATKGGIISFTKALAKELAYSNINVNAIAPGVVDTDMLNKLSNEDKQKLKIEIPFGRFASTSEIAELALFLSSEKANYITGQVIQIDGGFN